MGGGEEREKRERGRERERLMPCIAVVVSYDRPSHPYNAGGRREGERQRDERGKRGRERLRGPPGVQQFRRKRN